MDETTPLRVVLLAFGLVLAATIITLTVFWQ
jgi:hypothetical protein